MPSESDPIHLFTFLFTSFSLSNLDDYSSFYVDDSPLFWTGFMHESSSIGCSDLWVITKPCERTRAKEFLCCAFILINPGCYPAVFLMKACEEAWKSNKQAAFMTNSIQILQYNSDVFRFFFLSNSHNCRHLTHLIWLCFLFCLNKS